MIDPFERYARPHPGTFDHALAITPDDDNDLPIIPSMMWLGTPGDVRITAVNGETVTFKNANLLPFLFRGRSASTRPEPRPAISFCVGNDEPAASHLFMWKRRAAWRALRLPEEGTAGTWRSS